VYNTKANTLGQSVQQSSLTCATSSHERSEFARLDISLNILEKGALALLVWNCVSDILEGEDRLILSNTTKFIVRASVVALLVGDSSLSLTRLLIARLLLSFHVLLNRLGDLASLEYCDRTSTFIGLLTLHSNGGKADEEDEHANDDTKVAPQMASGIAESGFGIIGSRYSERPRSTALDRA